MKTTRLSQFLFSAVAVAAVTFSLAVGAEAQTEGVLFSFNTGWKGNNPYGGLVFDSAGNLYGTTYNGGNPKTCNNNGCGVVFELSPSGSGWTEKVIHTFSGGWDGANSRATLIIDAAGNLYGTTTAGGDLTACRGFGCGVVFKLSPQSGGTWTETVLYAFVGGTKDGAVPTPNLTFDSAGNLYGTAKFGGSSAYCTLAYPGCGTAFKLSPTSSGPWKETILRAFPNGNDGAEPGAGLTLDAAGNLYGTTEFGGPQGNGIVYRLSPTSGGRWQETVLYQFGTLTTDGNFPLSTLTFDAAGNLYGTTAQGLGSSSWGTVFELSPTTSFAWQETQLHIFVPSSTDGIFPGAGVVFDSAGNLWGTTTSSLSGAGSVFKLSPSSSGTWIDSTFLFDNTDGYEPTAGLIFDAAGNLYGTTVSGGANTAYGVVFQIVP